MIDYIKVKDRSDLVRDKESQAILNTDLDGLNKYKQERDNRLKFAKIANEYEQLKNDVNEIKQMLKVLLERQQ